MPKLTVKQRQEKLFGELDLSGLEPWPLKLVDSAWSLMAENCDIFSFKPSTLSCTHSTKHVIKVTNDAPFKEWFRQIPPEMLDSGTIHPSQSAWCNAVVLVWKKDGSLHFCIDFCHLNAHTKKDSYPLPRTHEALESLVSAGHFSCLDLKSGFLQIRMDKSSKQYTAFIVGNLGFFDCNYMLLGLCNAPAMFQWLMKNCLGELNLTYCLIYLDDIVIFLKMAEEHLHHLCIVLEQFGEHNLKLKLSKHSCFRKEITYLAHWVLEDGVWPSNSNLEAIAECALPQSYKEVRVFLGFVGQYQMFIREFTCIAQPLSEYLTEEGASRKSEWLSLTEDAFKAFKALK